MTKGPGISRIQWVPQGMALGLCLFVLGACAGSRVAQSTDSPEAGRYSHTMHDRFYEAWTPPASLGAAPGKISVPVDVEIARDGRILAFKMVKSSGNQRLDQSIEGVGKRITRVTPPPLSSAKRRFHLRVNFEVDVKH